MKIKTLDKSTNAKKKTKQNETKTLPPKKQTEKSHST